MTNEPHVVEQQMLIRRPVAEVYEALANPEVTTKFWFTRSTGKLEEGRSVTWHWDMYGVSADVDVTKLVPDRLISIAWGEPKVNVDFSFDAVTENATYVVIRSYGFPQTGNELINALKDNMGGFTFILSGLKAWLEHGVQLNLVADKYPKEISERDSSGN